MTGEILLPTDGSKGAERGRERALELAEERGARLHVLFVVDERVHGATPALSSDEFFLERIEQEGMAVVESVAGAARERGIEVETDCIRGDPHRAIPEYATDHGVDLIVMGVHGVRAGRPPHHGSATETVLREADCEVLAV